MEPNGDTIWPEKRLTVPIIDGEKNTRALKSNQFLISFYRLIVVVTVELIISRSFWLFTLLSSLAHCRDGWDMTDINRSKFSDQKLIVKMVNNELNQMVSW